MPNQVTFSGALGIPALLLDYIVNRGKNKSKKELEEQMGLWKGMGIEPSTYSPEMRQKVADLAREAGLGSLPKETGPLVNIGPPSAPAMVNQPVSGIAPFPKTQADYERSLKGQMADLYTESEQTDIADKVSQMAKRSYEADQAKLSKEFSEEFFKTGMVKGLMNMGPEDIGSLTAKYSGLDPLTTERIIGGYGINPKDSLKEQKKNFAFKNISDFQLQKKGDLTKDLNFWTTKVFPYVDAGDAFAMLRHFTPSAGTKDKTTLNDIEASLVDRFLKGEDFNDRELVVLSNIALRFNPLVKIVMDNYMDVRLMKKDPIAKAEALKELNQALRDAMGGWLLGDESESTPTPTPVTKPAPKIKVDQVPKGGAPRIKPNPSQFDIRR